MQIPLQITVRNVALSKAAEEDIREKAAMLEGYYPRIGGCHVIVDASRRRKHKGRLYDVRIDLTIPGAEMAIKRESNEDLYVAIGDAFDAARRRLEDFARRRRGGFKTHEASPQGRVRRLFVEEGYGFLETSDGREIYFHRKSVLRGGFGRLGIGSKVRFAEEEGEKGPQASTVVLVGKQGAEGEKGDVS